MLPIRKKIDVLVLVEHVARELDVVCLLKAALERRLPGVEVRVESLLFDQAVTIAKYDPKVVLTPYFTDGTAKYLANLVSGFGSARFINLAFEQFLSSVTQAFKQPREAFAQRGVVHCSSSPVYTEFLLESGVAPERVAKIGSLSCSLLAEGYREFYRPRAEEYRRRLGREDRPLVFFPENFSAAFWTKKKKRHLLGRGLSEAQADLYEGFAKASLKACLEWTWRLAEEGRARVLLRPRPAHSAEDFRERCEEVAGATPSEVVISKEGTIREWILASDLTVSSYSTTLIDAGFAGRPTLLLAPVEVPEALSSPWLAHVPKAERYEAFAEAVAEPEGEAAARFHEWVRTSLFYEKDPYEELVGMIGEALERGAEANGAGRRAADSFGTIAKRAAVQWKDRRKLHGKLEDRFGGDRIDQGEIRERSEAWRGVLAGGLAAADRR